jgi:hypothetical protein
MTDSNKTAIAVLVDRSGSMALIRTDAEGAVNQFVEDQRNEPGACTVRLDQFDSEFENVYPSTDIKDVPKFVLSPRGATALTDAIGKTVTEFGAELAALPEDERPGTVIVVIVTDGYENASREWTTPAVHNLITEQQDKYNWKFVFLAAGQDAIATGGAYGFAQGGTMTFDTNNIGGTFASTSTYVTNVRGGNKSYEFTDEDRENAVK